MAEKEYIERDTLNNDLDWFAPEAFNALIDKINKIIRNQPTADVQEVRHGKWELIDECANEGVYCSNCRKKVYRAKYANQKVKSNYCPNCGAKMDKE